MKYLTKTQLILYTGAALCWAAGAFFAFCMIGYGMTALVLAFGGICLALFAMLSRRDTRMSRRLRLALVLFLTVGFCCFLAAEIPVLLDARSAPDTAAPYLIVCGAGINGTQPSRSMTDRLERALLWLRENPDGVAILSGSQGPGEELSEAQVMYRWLMEKGVPADRLIPEDKAGSSYENIQNSLALITERGGDPAGRVAILSSEYHLHRLGYMAQRMGCQPVLVAARTTKVSLFINYAIREAFAMWELWVFGM